MKGYGWWSPVKPFSCVTSLLVYGSGEGKGNCSVGIVYHTNLLHLWKGVAWISYSSLCHLQSLDYDICYNVPYKEMIRRYTRKVSHCLHWRDCHTCLIPIYRWSFLKVLPLPPPPLPTIPSLSLSLTRTQTYIHMEIMRWVLVGIIGTLTGIVAFLINISVKYLFKLKFGLFDRSKNRLYSVNQSFTACVVLLYGSSLWCHGRQWWDLVWLPHSPWLQCHICNHCFTACLFWGTFIVQPLFRDSFYIYKPCPYILFACSCSQWQLGVEFHKSNVT